MEPGRRHALRVPTLNNEDHRRLQSLRPRLRQLPHVPRSTRGDRVRKQSQAAFHQSDRLHLQQHSVPRPGSILPLQQEIEATPAPTMLPSPDAPPGQLLDPTRLQRLGDQRVRVRRHERDQLARPRRHQR